MVGDKVSYSVHLVHGKWMHILVPDVPLILCQSTSICVFRRMRLRRDTMSQERVVLFPFLRLIRAPP